MKISTINPKSNATGKKKLTLSQYDSQGVVRGGTSKKWNMGVSGLKVHGKYKSNGLLL